MKLATKIRIRQLVVRPWLVSAFVLIIVAQSTLASIDAYSGEELTSPNNVSQISFSFLQSTKPIQKLSDGLIFCKESKEDSRNCCVHCCSCQIFLFSGLARLRSADDNNFYHRKSSSVYLAGIIPVPFRPPKTESSIRY